MKKIQINLKLIVVVLLAVVGVFFCVKGAKNLSDCKKAISFKDLKESDIKDGTYVCGDIENFVIRTEMVNDEYVKSAVSQTFIEYDGESDVYTIPVKENQYIQLMASSERAKKELNNMLEDSSKKTYFEGIVVKRDIGVNEPWYGAVDNHLYPGINHVISDYYIREIDKEDFWDDIKLGAILLVVAVLMYIDGGGYEGFVEEINIKQDIKKAATLADIDNKEEELISKEFILRQLTRRQKRIKKKKSGSIMLTVVGTMWIFVMTDVFLIGLVVMLFGAKGFLEWFLNSSNIHGIKLAKKLRYDSLYVMIEQCKRDIKELEELVYNEEKDQGLNM